MMSSSVTDAMAASPSPPRAGALDAALCTSSSMRNGFPPDSRAKPNEIRPADSLEEPRWASAS